MKEIEIHGSTGRSHILIGEKLLNLTRYTAGRKTTVITDTNVWELYKDIFPSCAVIKIGIGEEIKTLKTIEDIIEKLVEFEVDRSSLIVGIGGGIVCDIAGFAASVYLRGIEFGFVSTTLLSQVDASVGGKNGVNFSGYKNMIGVFNQPEFVICDTKLLNTLPKDEILCGFGEIVKHALIADSDMFSFLENNFEKAVSLDKKVIEKLICDSVDIKSSIVNKDEKEKGERRKLNFGHTFGHAVEKTTGIPHGKAVSIGIIAASALSRQRGLLSIDEEKRVQNLVTSLNLPVRIDADQGKILDAMKKDKKRQGEKISFILLQGIGKAVVEDISIEELEHVCQSNIWVP